MYKTGVAYHEDCQKHIPYEGNPEIPERISTTVEYLKNTGIVEKVHLITPEPAEEEDLLRVHAEDMVDYIRNLSENGYGENDYVNSDLFVGKDTYQAALAAAGGAKAAAESVWTGNVDNAFALVRPPGHHASRDLPAGFCYFNNAATAIEYLRAKHGVKKVAVFDWDAHCGNGTMNIFYKDPAVLTISVHQDPHTFYPGTGFVEQIGEGRGRGYCMNIPVPAGTGDADYMHILDKFVVPKLGIFKPDIIFIAAGQDSHAGDGYSGLELTDDGYAAMTATLLEAASKLCAGRLVLTLEGGYNLETLPMTHHRIVSALLDGEKPDISGKVTDSTEYVLRLLKAQLADTLMGD